MYLWCLCNFYGYKHSCIALMHFVDQALVDAPDMIRSQINFKRLSLTDIKIDIKRVPKKTTLIKAMEEAGNDEVYAVDLISIVALYSSRF